MSEDVYDTEVLQKLALASEVYRNFAMGDLPGFKEDFDRGYQAVADHYRSLYGREQTRDQNQSSDSPNEPPSGFDLDR